MGQIQDLNDLKKDKFLWIQYKVRAFSWSLSVVLNTFWQWSEEAKVTNRRQLHKRQFKLGKGRNVSQHIIHRSLLCVGLHSCKSIRISMLINIHLRKSFQWAHYRSEVNLVSLEKSCWSSITWITEFQRISMPNFKEYACPTNILFRKSLQWGHQRRK